MGTIQLLLVVVGAIAVTAVANRRGLQPSIVVVVLASAVSFVPGLPRFELDPELILSVVLPPLLYSAALDFSVYSLARNLRPILSLGVGMVIVSTLVTGAVANWVVPGLGVVAALVLGAVVAPPDAVSAVAIGRKLGLPKRLMTILTGESLVNDATALTIFTLAVAAATGSHPFIDNAILLFLYATVVGCGVGLALAAGVHWARQRLGESGLETVLGLVVPFAAYLFAEELHGSGVLAVVTAGFWLGHHDADAGFATRLQGRQVWRSLDTLLEAFVFAYMGLQCKFVFDDLPIHGDEWGRFVLSAVVVLLTVLLIRPFWVFLTYGQRVLRRRYLSFLPRRPRRPDATRPLPRAQLLVVSWSGMRGVVTMAAAAGVPAMTASGEPFPGRSIIQALAFVVAVGSLLIQVPTLPMLVRRLGISADDERAAETAATRRARHIARAAAERALRDLLAEPPSGVDPAAMTAIRERMAAAMRARQSADDRDVEVEEAERSPAVRQAMLTVRREMLAAQRRALTAARDAGELDDEVMRRELERLDYEEAAAAAD
ncbi:Na+/H+ antiporter [Jiangella rhizosphaerae]|uniref:Na+/H+ antiporter n=1 Tax=Jiangella rhizosphaerae TaxID=2293569 RepID=A0A418KSW3_9ACTN|nr:Na+/H+ antiporter [Jiangella rhizosphaerae]RIQ27128.1 Na+/H+ antiporter [Jiangella rhizosphaerae]